jgi:hypothetical protein
MAGLDTTIRNSSRLSPSEKTLGERREEFTWGKARGVPDGHNSGDDINRSVLLLSINASLFPEYCRITKLTQLTKLKIVLIFLYLAINV